MHILFLTDNFPPEVNAPASRTFEHCREWVKLGAQVTVITCAPNFPKGKIFPGYKNSLYSVHESSGIKVIRVWSYISANEGFIRRIADYISYMLSSIIASIFVKKVDIIVGTSPQFFTACAAAISSKFKRTPWIFELRDIWPESIKAVGAMKDSLAIRCLEKVEMSLYRNCSSIVAVTHAFKDTLSKRGIEPSKIHVITNGVDLTNYYPREKDGDLVNNFKLAGKFIAGYIGTHGLAHGLDTLLDAAEILQEHPSGRDIIILLLGDGAKKSDLIEQSKSRNLTNVIFIDSVSKEQVSRYWSLLDASIIHLKKTDLFTSVIPSKLFECMGMGIPVLLGVQGESAEIVFRENVGIPFEPENANELTQALIKLKSDPCLYQTLKSNCTASAVKYDRTALAREMLQILSSLRH